MQQAAFFAVLAELFHAGRLCPPPHTVVACHNASFNCQCSVATVMPCQSNVVTLSRCMPRGTMAVHRDWCRIAGASWSAKRLWEVGSVVDYTTGATGAANNHRTDATSKRRSAPQVQLACEGWGGRRADQQDAHWVRDGTDQALTRPMICTRYAIGQRCKEDCLRAFCVFTNRCDTLIVLPLVRQSPSPSPPTSGSDRGQTLTQCQ